MIVLRNRYFRSQFSNLQRRNYVTNLRSRQSWNKTGISMGSNSIAVPGLSSGVHLQHRKAGAAKQSLKLDPAASGTFVPNLSNWKAMQATECKASARKTSRALSNIMGF